VLGYITAFTHLLHVNYIQLTHNFRRISAAQRHVCGSSNTQFVASRYVLFVHRPEIKLTLQTLSVIFTTSIFSFHVRALFVATHLQLLIQCRKIA
jgi:hypothetical protein